MLKQLLLPAVAAAAVSSAAACPIQEAVLSEAAKQIQQLYIIPDEARRIAEDLRQMAASGRFAAQCANREQFAKDVEAELDRRDPHFRFEVTSAAAPDMQQSTAQWLAKSAEQNAGVREARVLDGRIAYIRVSSFYGAAEMRPKLDAAFALVAGSRALILDLRRNNGGDGEGAGVLAGKILTPGAKPALALETRAGRAIEPPPQSDPARFDETKPIAILIDRRTASAAEWQAFNAQATGRARIIGDRSFGAAHLIGDPVRLAHGYSLSIPDARPVSIATGKSWERVGVTPDIPGGDDPIYTAMRALEADLASVRR